MTYNQDCINLKDANLDSASYRDILLNISHSQDEKLKELTDKIENALMVTEETKHALEDPVPATRRGFYGVLFTALHLIFFSETLSFI